jgi:uncharacterized metal-binding protein
MMIASGSNESGESFEISHQINRNGYSRRTTKVEENISIPSRLSKIICQAKFIEYLCLGIPFCTPKMMLLGRTSRFVRTTSSERVPIRSA